MIYLIATSMLFVEDMHSETILKIGYSDDARGDGRFQDYTNNGMTLKVLSIIPGGSLVLEGLVQDYFKKYSIPTRSKEWFFYTNEIIDFFNRGWTDRSLTKYLLDNFKDRIYLLPSLNEQLELLVNSYNSILTGPDEISKQLSILLTLKSFQERLEYICTTVSNILQKGQLDIFLNNVPMIFKDSFLILGPERCKALRYRKSDLQREFDRLFNNVEVEDMFSSEIYNTIEIGKRYKKSDLKELIKHLCEKTGKVVAPKANIINDYFETKEVIIIDKDTKKRDSGFEILARKEK